MIYLLIVKITSINTEISKNLKITSKDFTV